MKYISFSLSFLCIFISKQEVSLCILLVLYFISLVLILIKAIVPSLYPTIISNKSSVVSMHFISLCCILFGIILYKFF